MLEAKVSKPPIYSNRLFSIGFSIIDKSHIHVSLIRAIWNHFISKVVKFINKTVQRFKSIPPHPLGNHNMVDHEIIIGQPFQKYVIYLFKFTKSIVSVLQALHIMV
jgi:hypothetical protein